MADEKDKPAFNEQALDRLLEAAFVLQEHNRELKSLEQNLERQREKAQQQASFVPPPSSPTPRSDDYTLTLAQIVETQHQIQARHLELEDTLLLVAERVMQISNAGGAGIGILDGKKMFYRAAAGSMTLPVGTEVPLEKALCVASLRTGQVIRCSDVNAEFLLDVEECLRRGIQSLIAVPVYHESGTAGGLELYYSTIQAFTEQDVHTCQLMAGLITEALARNEELALKKSLAAERAVMREALEKLKPNLATLVDTPATKNSSGRTTAAATSSSAAFACRKCGHQLMGQEQFCGKCGTPRSSDYEPPSMQSKVASLWQMQEASKKSTDIDAPPNGDLSSKASPALVEPGVLIRRPEKPLADSIEEEMPELFVAPELRAGTSEEPLDAPPVLRDLESTAPVLTVAAETAEGDEKPAAGTALTKTDHAWSSAAKARDFLEQLAGANRPGGLSRFWNARRGDIYLAVAVILVAVVIRWGIWSSHPVSATGGPNAAASHRKAAPDADLSFFDRLLISLGLAEVPPAPETKGGNPDTQVWVDLHTALYYCPGTELYGKTPKGRFASQRDAQLDQFEPASRKACD